MNRWQQAKQIAWLLDAARWPDGAAGRVFPSGSVRVVSGSDPGLRDLRKPLALIMSAGEEADPQVPELVRCRWRVFVLTRVEGAEMSQAATIGGQRTGGVGASEGRGLLEIGEEVCKAMALLTGANGVRAALAYASAAQSVEDEAGAVAGVEYEFDSWATVRRHYDSPLFLAGTGGSGQVSLSWVNAPTRWDQYDASGTRLAPIVRYASGATAPTSPTSGNSVSGISAGDTSKTVTGLSAGTYSFAIFQPYTESGDSSAERYSSQETSTTALSITVS